MEFKDIIKEAGRCCAFYKHNCEACSLTNVCLVRLYIDEYINGGNDAYFERRVMAWAAEHPELIYPTWHDYLHSIGVLYKKHTAGGDVTEIHWGNMMTPIPAEIARKLDIEPKEIK